MSQKMVPITFNTQLFGFVIFETLHGDNLELSASQ